LVGATAGDGEIVVAETSPDGEIFFEGWDISSDIPRLVREKRVIKQADSAGPRLRDIRSAIAGAAFYHLDTLIYTPTAVAAFTGTAPRTPLLVRSSDFEVLEKAGENQRSGLLSFGEHVFVYFARSDGNLALWSGQSGSFITLPKVRLESEDKLAIDPTGSTLLITRQSSTLEVWNIPARTKQATIQGSRIKDSFYTSEGAAIATVQEGGTVRLWSLTGDSLGTIGGVSGANVIVRRKDCRVVVWTTEGQVLTFLSGWQILGILFFPHRECL
jgi:WD40 repeat protein